MKVMDIAEPVAGPGEVLVDVRAVGICGSELEGFASRSPFRVPPLVMGHEFAGTRLDTGTRVVVNPVVSCLVCDLCGRGLVNVCRHREILGIQRPGGYAERVAVPAANCVAVPDDVPFPTLALTEPLANAVHAFRLVQVHDAWPQRIGIIGCGMLGLAVGLVARSRGVPHIEINDLSGPRLAAAEREGLTAVEGGLEGEYDAVFDTVGSAATRGASVARVRPGGSAVWVGLHSPEADVDGQAMIRREVRVLTTFCYDRTDFAVAAELVQTLRPDWVASHPLSDGDNVFLSLLRGPAAAVKSMLVR
jgi:threonine dehydrogenase-like Zn-dependent dehydrogenase